MMHSKKTCVSGFIAAAMLLLASTLPGCAWLGLEDQRNASFERIAPSGQAKEPSGVFLLLVGGNSECRGNKGLWPIRKKVVNDLAAHLGLERGAISTDYVAWTGDPGDDPWCLPGNPNYLSGHILITERLRKYETSDDIKLLVIVSWSNGAATAAQLSEHLRKNDGPFVHLLVTLDPVSRLTDRPKDAGADKWLNVYTASSGPDKLRTSNIIAKLGGAWDEFEAPNLVSTCMKGNHGQVKRMWRGVIIPSLAFQQWAKDARDIIGSETPKSIDIPDPGYRPC